MTYEALFVVKSKTLIKLVYQKFQPMFYHVVCYLQITVKFKNNSIKCNNVATKININLPNELYLTNDV